MEKAEVSLIIATYNWPEALELVLSSVLAQTRLPKEVLIADDGSRRETADLIKKYQGIFNIPLKHFWQEDKGFRKTIILNETFKNASGNYIVQIDGDIILNENFIKDHVDKAKEGYFIKGSRSMLSKEKSEKILASKQISLYSFMKGVKSKINGTRFPLLSFLFYGNPQKSNDLRGCNFAVWKKDFIAVNGYNNDLTGWGHEDIELAARLVNSGIKRRQLKLCAVCYHIYHPLNSRSNEDHNMLVYQQTVDNKIKYCKNGYATL